MKKPLAAFVALFVVLLALDGVWLGVVAMPLYQQGIGHLMADEPRLAVALLFYPVYAFGLLLFVVMPQAGQSTARNALWGALFGFFAYATYDLTNQATLRDWPLAVTLADIPWGAFVTAVGASAGFLAASRFA